MSLVGPRPIVEAEIQKYGSKFGLYTKVKSGLTGMWQISGRSDTTYEDRVQLDAFYVRNWSVWLDLYILFRTIEIVLLRKGAY
jgi:lipopolysaccharide/colanic/teichoic acid biosynthesis glycosyltransferase